LLHYFRHVAVRFRERMSSDFDVEST
jgi:hypothetical protein